MPTPIACALLWSAVVPLAAQDPPRPPDATRALFVQNCAQCHGEKGDGEGVTQLDRRARSFLEGGFSYGNTKDAIVRSITHGIPGTPMPSFEKALTAEQRAALADYVIAFGPERIVVDPSESEMVVRDRPLVVRGKLPSIAEGAPEIARGLAVGTLDGMTFEYRTDEVRLVGVRAGRFVNRTDWGERGGTALEMLGKVVWHPPVAAVAAPAGLGLSLAGSDAGSLRESRPVVARFAATAVRDGAAWVEYALRDDAGAADRVHVRERCAPFRNDLGSGFVQSRRFRTTERGTYVGVLDLPADVPTAGAKGCVGALVGGAHPMLLVATARTANRTVRRDGAQRLFVELAPGDEQQVDVHVLTDLAPGATWNDAFRERLIRRFCP